jgi:hypothetical protein
MGLIQTFSSSRIYNFNSVALVCERTIPTERQPLAGEVSADFLQVEGCRVVRAADPLLP